MKRAGIIEDTHTDGLSKLGNGGTGEEPEEGHLVFHLLERTGLRPVVMFSCVTSTSTLNPHSCSLNT